MNRSPAPARPREQGRLGAIRADFFLDERHRLSEQERALMGAMLATLLDQLVDELLGLLPPLLGARIEPARQRVASRLWNDGSLAGDGVVGLLVRRSDEQRILAAGRRTAEGSGPIDQLVADPDEGVAVAAMGVTVARGRRRDRFGRIGLDFDDLDPGDAVALVNRLAVAARIESGLDGMEVDAEIAGCAQRLAARHAPDNSLDRQTDRLAEAMRVAGRDDSLELGRLCAEGEAGLVAALLAKRAGIESATGWCLLAEEGAAEVVLLARMAALDRADAARLIATLGDALEVGDPVSAIAAFDALPAAEIDDQRRWYRLPHAYRDALRWTENRG